MNNPFDSFNPFNELSVGNAYYIFDKSIRSMLTAFSSNRDGFQYVMYYVSEFLCCKESDPYLIKSLLHKYVVLLMYYIYKNNSCFDKLNDVSKFNEYIYEGVGNLSSISFNEKEIEKNIFIKTFICKDYKELEKNIKKILNLFKSKGDTRIRDSIKSLSGFLYDYFKYENASKSLDEFMNIDLLIAHHLNNPDKTEFTFELKDKSIMNACLNLTPKKIAISGQYLLGLFINTLFEKKYFVFNNRTIKLDRSVSYQAKLANQKMIMNKINFVKTINPNTNEVMLDKSLITEFEFIYDNTLYKFTKNGIER